MQNVTCRFRPLTLASQDASSAPDAGKEGGAGTGAAAWQACTSPQAYSGLAEGRYGLTLKATDNAGLATQVPGRLLWLADVGKRVLCVHLPLVVVAYVPPSRALRPACAPRTD